MTETQRAIFESVVGLKEQLAQAKAEIAELRQWINKEAPRIAGEKIRQAAKERDQAIQRAEKAKAELAEQKERARVGRIHAMQTKARLCAALLKAEEIAKEVCSVLADDHNNDAGCLFFGAIGPDVGCFACVAQDRLADIAVQARAPEAGKNEAE